MSARAASPVRGRLDALAGPDGRRWAGVRRGEERRGVLGFGARRRLCNGEFKGSARKQKYDWGLLVSAYLHPEGG